MTMSEPQPVGRGPDERAPEAQAQEELRQLREILLHPEALATPVREGLFVAIHENRDAVADVIFPVIGPAIRRAISQALRQLVNNTDRLLNDSLSLRSLSWRFEAVTTGRSFAEVALSRSLLYRVEQVYLIHRDTGLLIGHVAEPTVVARAPEVVSGMLTAIRDFVQDSFGGADGGVHRLEVGERTIWVEQQGTAILAVVVHGLGPEQLSWRLQTTLEQILADYGPAVMSFDGDRAPLADVEPLLQDCLQSELRPARPRQPWLAYALLIGVAVALAVGASVLGVQSLDRQERAARAVDALRREPGYRVLDQRSTTEGLRVIGLRDPLSRPMNDVLADISGSPDIIGVWGSVADPRLALRRARTTLLPPDGVRFELAEGTLVVTGTVTGTWLVGLERAARAIVGIDRVDTSAVQSAEASALRAAERAVQVRRVRFETGAVVPSAGTEVEALRTALQALDRAAVSAGVWVTARIEGRADPTGTEEANRALSRARAEQVASALRIEDFWAIRFTVVGLGAPSASDRAAPDREVRIRVVAASQP